MNGLDDNGLDDDNRLTKFDSMDGLDDNGLVGLNWIRLATDWMMTIAALLTQFARSLGAVRIGQSGGLII